jgi:hypothetical protein
MKWLVIASGLMLVACDSGGRKVDDAAVIDVSVIDSLLPPDAPPPPPTVDAGPPPVVSCGDDAGTCELPPSSCLDASYMIYYTGGTCNDGVCELTQNLMYCPWGCLGNGCGGGFT